MKSFFTGSCGLLMLAITFSAGYGATSAGEDSLLQAKKHFSFALQYKKSGDSAEALRQYEKSIAYCDTLYQVHFSFAELLMNLKRPELAEAEYRRTITLNPAHYPSALMLAGMYAAPARYDSALAMYEIMYRLQPDKTVLTTIAKLRGYLGKNAEGFQAAQSLVEQGEDSRDNLHLAAELALKAGNTEEANGFILRALKKNPGDRELLRLGVKTTLALGDSSQATGYLIELAQRDSTNIAVLAELKNLCRAREDRKELIRALERHHRLAPADLKVIGELAETCIAEGELLRGEELVRAGLNLTPKDGRLHIILGELYRRRDKKDKALSEYKIALEDPHWAETARQSIARLQQPREDPLKKEKDFFGRGKTKSK